MGVGFGVAVEVGSGVGVVIGDIVGMGVMIVDGLGIAVGVDFGMGGIVCGTLGVGSEPETVVGTGPSAGDGVNVGWPSQASIKATATQHSVATPMVQRSCFGSANEGRRCVCFTVLTFPPFKRPPSVGRS